MENKYSCRYEKIEIVRPRWLGGDKWVLNDLKKLTVVLGKNGSGKSVMLREWRDQDPDNIHYIVPERTGEIAFNANYLSSQMSGNERRETGRSNFTPDYRQQIITRIQSYFMARGSVRGEVLPGDPSDLEELLSKLLTDFTIKLSATSNPPYVLERMNSSERVTSTSQLSSGEAQLLTVALDALTVAAIWDLDQNDGGVLLIDEPDAHIHPDLQVRFADFLTEIAIKYNTQIIVATHSTTLLSAIGQFGGEEACVIHLSKERSTFNAVKFDKSLKEISACLGGHALMGPLFGVPLLLVEGDDDYRIWSQVPRHHKTSFSVIPCGGDEIKKYQKTLEKIFNSLKNENCVVGYALLDGDKNLPIESKDQPQKYIRYIGLKCHESENLYLTDEVLLTMGLNWEQAAEKIIEEANKFGNKEAFLKKARNWNRKEIDIKNYISEISIILDDKKVHWTLRTAKTIGREKPTGQLLEFLGEDVVNSLWKN